jgi:hypothetical protein
MPTPAQNLQNWRPNLTGKIHPEAEQAIQRIYDGLKDHDQAITTLAGKTTSTTSTSSSSTASTASAAASTAATVKASTVAAAVSASSAMIASTFGNVNQQSANYTVQSTDYGSLVTFQNSGPVTAMLNQAVATNYFGAVQNNGTAAVTLMPGTNPTGAPAQINNVASLALEPNQGAWVFFDGMSWWAVTSLAATGFANPMTAEGDLIAGGTAGAPERLGIGANGDVLTSNGTDPAWAPLPASGGVSSVNSLTGALTLAEGTNVTITNSGETITIAATGGGSGGYLKGSGNVPVNSSSPAGNSYTTSITVAGAAVGNPVLVSPGTANITSVCILTGYVTAANTVQVALTFPTNYPGGGGTISSPPVFVVVFP